MTFNLNSLTSLVLGSQDMALLFSCSLNSNSLGSHNSNNLGQLMTCKVKVGDFGLKAKLNRPNKMQKLCKLFLQPNP
jgi:hypothetical protein